MNYKAILIDGLLYAIISIIILIIGFYIYQIGCDSYFYFVQENAYPILVSGLLLGTIALIYFCIRYGKKHRYIILVLFFGIILGYLYQTSVSCCVGFNINMCTTCYKLYFHINSWQFAFYSVLGIFIFSFIIFLLITTYNNHKTSKILSKKIFLDDMPYSMRMSDAHIRTKEIENFYNMIKDYNVKNLSIGVICNRGSGKTSFIQGLKDKLDKEKILNSIDVDFFLGDNINIITSKLVDDYKNILKKHLGLLYYFYNLDEIQKFLDVFDIPNKDIFKGLINKLQVYKLEAHKYPKVFIYIDDVDRIIGRDNNDVTIMHTLKIINYIQQKWNNVTIISLISTEQFAEMKQFDVNIDMKYLEKFYDLYYHLSQSRDSFHNTYQQILNDLKEYKEQEQAQNKKCLLEEIYDFLRNNYNYHKISAYLDNPRMLKIWYNSFVSKTLEFDHLGILKRKKDNSDDKDAFTIKDLCYLSIMDIIDPQWYMQAERGGEGGKQTTSLDIDKTKEQNILETTIKKILEHIHMLKTVKNDLNEDISVINTLRLDYYLHKQYAKIYYNGSEGCECTPQRIETPTFLEDINEILSAGIPGSECQKLIPSLKTRVTKETISDGELRTLLDIFSKHNNYELSFQMPIVLEMFKLNHKTIIERMTEKIESGDYNKLIKSFIGNIIDYRQEGVALSPLYQNALNQIHNSMKSYLNQLDSLKILLEKQSNDLYIWDDFILRIHQCANKIGQQALEQTYELIFALVQKDQKNLNDKEKYKFLTHFLSGSSKINTQDWSTSLLQKLLHILESFDSKEQINMNNFGTIRSNGAYQKYSLDEYKDQLQNIINT